MAALVVQSRFAGLKIEDDEPSRGQKGRKNKTNNVNKPVSEPAKKNKGNNKPQSAPKKKKSKHVAVSAEQWEEWRQKDEQLVDGSFETEMQQAILLSKLDYEEKKDVYKQLKKEAEKDKKLQDQSQTGVKKQKKKQVMSLNQFNEMVNAGEDTINNGEVRSFEDPKSPDKDTEFFERVKTETKNEILKDKIIDRVKIRQNASDDVINRVQFNDALERKDKEIESLKQEVLTLKKELSTVKARNKMLCNILGQADIKDKAEVLIEVERLRNVQAELTGELASLHTELEKERSKNADPRTKDKKKKNLRSDASTEANSTGS